MAKKDPWWVKRVRYLRSTFVSYEKIADELGRSEDEVRAVMGVKPGQLRPGVVQAADPEKLTRNSNGYPLCDTCGRTMSKQAKLSTCIDCRIERFAKRVKTAVDMWNEADLTCGQIAEQMGEKRGQVSGLLAYARQHEDGPQPRRRKEQ